MVGLAERAPCTLPPLTAMLTTLGPKRWSPPPWLGLQARPRPWLSCHRARRSCRWNRRVGPTQPWSWCWRWNPTCSWLWRHLQEKAQPAQPEADYDDNGQCGHGSRPAPTEAAAMRVSPAPIPVPILLMVDSFRKDTECLLIVPGVASRQSQPGLGLVGRRFTPLRIRMLVSSARNGTVPATCSRCIHAYVRLTCILRTLRRI